ncbi:MAG: metallophosphoesterase family protein [bacterium]|nr:metallophosphatase family protein [bacterium]MBU1916951.1 metallophosphatase family protein [bacterium]
MTTIGILSDTHRVLQREVITAFKDVNYIIHAGDIERPQVLAKLKTLAPVYAVQGNVDNSDIFPSLPTHDLFEIEGMTFYLLHNMNTLDIDPQAAGVQIIIHGHTHKQRHDIIDGIHYINPGTASGIRNHGSVALLEVDDKNVNVRFINY